jgi:hypothetical protein
MDERGHITLRVARWTPEPVFAINTFPDERDLRSVRETLESYCAVLHTHLRYVNRVLQTDMPERIEISMLDGAFLVDEIKLDPGRLERLQDAALNDIQTTHEEGTQ